MATKLALVNLRGRAHNTQQFQFIHMPFFPLSINHMASCVLGAVTTTETYFRVGIADTKRVRERPVVCIKWCTHQLRRIAQLE